MGLLYVVKKSFMDKELKKHLADKSFSLERAEAYELGPDDGLLINNSYYFTAHDLRGNSFFSRIGKRPGGVWEIWFTFKPAGQKAWTYLEQYVSKDKSPFALVRDQTILGEYEGHFAGQVTDGALTRFLDLSFTFKPRGRAFDFGTMAPTSEMAKAVARHHWSKEYFAELKDNDQVHYEQPGQVTLSYSFDGSQSQKLELPAVRDHSYGKRDWDFMNRHIWLLALMADGSVVQVCLADYPTLRDFVTGYVYKDGSYQTLTDIGFAGFTKDGREPESLQVTAKTGDGGKLGFTAQVESYTPYVFASKYRFFEGLATFKAGEKTGRGIVEFGYNVDKKRW